MGTTITTPLFKAGHNFSIPPVSIDGLGVASYLGFTNTAHFYIWVMADSGVHQVQPADPSKAHQLLEDPPVAPIVAFWFLVTFATFNIQQANQFPINNAAIFDFFCTEVPRSDIFKKLVHESYPPTGTLFSQIEQTWPGSKAATAHTCLAVAHLIQRCKAQFPDSHDRNFWSTMNSFRMIDNIPYAISDIHRAICVLRYGFQQYVGLFSVGRLIMAGRTRPIELQCTKTDNGITRGVILTSIAPYNRLPDCIEDGKRFKMPGLCHF